MGTYTLHPVPLTRPAPAVAQSLATYITDNRLENLEREHMSVLLALAEGISEHPSKSWGAWFTQVKDYLYVALCDEELCGLAETSLKHIYQEMPQEALGTLHTLLSS